MEIFADNPTAKPCDKSPNKNWQPPRFIISGADFLGYIDIHEPQRIGNAVRRCLLHKTKGLINRITSFVSILR